MPSSSPGLSLPQMLVVALGAGLALFGWLLRRAAFRERLTTDLRANFGKGAIVAAITLLALELLLTQLGIGTYFRFDLPPFDGLILDWFHCGDGGCHYDVAKLTAACQRGEASGRRCAVNQAGYRDDDEFVAPDAKIMRRILLLGDSFTHGFSADLGSSFAEILDAQLSDALVWNTGITGNGTNSALAAYETWAPVLQPQLTILGFYTGNDFIDNQYPLDSWFRVELADGLRRSVRRYSIDRLGNPVRLDLETALRFHARVKPAPNSPVEAALGSTRLGTLLLRLLDAVSERLIGDDFARQKMRTARYLERLRVAAKAQGSDLLVLLIPTAQDTLNPGKSALAAEALMESLGIAWIDSADIVQFADYKATNMDPHWLNSGHAKIGDMLTECVTAYFVAGSLSACEPATLP